MKSACKERVHDAGSSTCILTETQKVFLPLKLVRSVFIKLQRLAGGRVRGCPESEHNNNNNRKSFMVSKSMFTFLFFCIVVSCSTTSSTDFANLSDMTLCDNVLNYNGRSPASQNARTQELSSWVRTVLPMRISKGTARNAQSALIRSDVADLLGRTSRVERLKYQSPCESSGHQMWLIS